MEPQVAAQRLIFDERDHIEGMSKAEVVKPVNATPETFSRYARRAAREERHGRCWARSWAAEGVHVFVEDLAADAKMALRHVALAMGLPRALDADVPRGLAGAWAPPRPCRLRVERYDDVLAALAAADFHGCDECKRVDF